MNLRNSILLFLLFSFNRLCVCQTSYSLNGTITGVGSGKIFIVPVSNSFGIHGGKLDSTNIVNGKFHIDILYTSRLPTAYRLIIVDQETKRETGFIFLEAKKQKVIIDSINEYRSPTIPNSNLQKELKKEYESFFKDIVVEGTALDTRIERAYEKFNDNLPPDSINVFLNLIDVLDKRGDLLMTEYCRLHPKSYVALWKLIDRFEERGYRSAYEMAFHSLSGEIKGSAIGTMFNESLQKARALAPGNPFPKLKLYEIDSADSSATLSLNKGSNRFTLINFWFSSCGPCLREFRELKKIYNHFRPYGFEVVGISVDRKQDFDKLKSAITNSQLLWPQYIDWDGKESASLSIHSFPTTFLLDQNGVIIKENIRFDDLRSILEESKLKSIYWNTGDLEPL